MDIEDLFNEEFKETDSPLVIPEFGPCSGDGDQEETKESCKKDQKNTLTCSDLKKCCKEEETKVEKMSSQMVSELKCFKCKVNPPNFTNKQDKVCKVCFLDILIHRFKSSLRQNLKIWKDDLNLVCISGGSNSMALLNMLYLSLFGNQSNRKMFFRVHILYIDEGPVVYQIDPEQHLKNLNLIKEACESYKFTYTILPLEAIYDIDDERTDLRVSGPEEAQKIEEEKKRDEEQHTEQDALAMASVTNARVEVPQIEEKRDKLRELMECLPTISNFREDLIMYLKRWLIVAFALKYNFKKILFGTTGHKVATQLLAQLAKGRGASIAHEISYIDDKNFNGRLTFMNPMREFLHKEIALYNHLNKVEIIQQKPLAQLLNHSGLPFHGSADMLIESFFDRLQDKYNVNTVPTVVKLTNKLSKAVNLEGQTPYPFCPLCLGVRDTVTNLLEMGSTIKSNIAGEVKKIERSEEWLVGAEDIGRVLCFGCKRMIISCGATEKRIKMIELMPKVVSDNSKRALESEQPIV